MIRRAVFRSFSRLISRRLSAASLQDQRRFMAQSSNYSVLPAGTATAPLPAGGVPAEWIDVAGAAPDGVLLYLHGGGFIMGWYGSHRWLVAHLCRAGATRALAVDYRLAPEHPFPAALDDCVAAYRWLIQIGFAPEKIVIAGDSAGGNLALTTMLALRDAGEPLPAAAVCISPATDLALTGESFWTKRDPMIEAATAAAMVRQYVGDHDSRLPLLSPLYADLRGLPPLLIHVGADEILLSDATRLASRAQAAGVDVRLEIWPDMWHVWHMYVPYLPEARQAVAAIGTFIQQQIERPQAVLTREG